VKNGYEKKNSKSHGRSLTHRRGKRKPPDSTERHRVSPTKQYKLTSRYSNRRMAKTRAVIACEDESRCSSKLHLTARNHSINTTYLKQSRKRKRWSAEPAVALPPGHSMRHATWLCWYILSIYLSWRCDNPVFTLPLAVSKNETEPVLWWKSDSLYLRRIFCWTRMTGTSQVQCLLNQCIAPDETGGHHDQQSQTQN